MLSEYSYRQGSAGFSCALPCVKPVGHQNVVEGAKSDANSLPTFGTIASKISSELCSESLVMERGSCRHL